LPSESLSLEAGRQDSPEGSAELRAGLLTGDWTIRDAIKELAVRMNLTADRAERLRLDQQRRELIRGAEESLRTPDSLSAACPQPVDSLSAAGYE